MRGKAAIERLSDNGRGGAGPVRPVQGSLAGLKAREFRAPRHKIIYDVGLPASELFELTSGWAMVMCRLPTGARKIVDIVGANRLFGFCTGPAHTCMAISLTPVRGRAFDVAEIMRNPERVVWASNAAIGEIQRLRDLAVIAARRGAVERVASFVALQLSRGVDRPQSVAMPLNRSELADLLNLKLETVSRAFAKLRESGVLSDELGQISVLSPSRLREFAAHGSATGV